MCSFDCGLNAWLLSICACVELFGRRQFEPGTFEADNFGNPRNPDVVDRIPAAIVKNVAGQDVEKFATEVLIGQRSPTDVGQGQLEFAKADIAAHPTSLRWTADSIEKPDNPLRVFDSGRIAVVDFYEAGPVVLIGAGLYILRSHCGTPNAQLIGESE